MKDLILENKTGFETSLPFEIRDNKNNIFYDSNFTDHIKEGKLLQFNLPPGIYTYDGFFRKLNLPVNTVTVDLPPKERNYKIPKKRYRIIFDDNKNKCSIFYKRGLIIFDNSFKDAPLYIKYGIYFHELGHHYYKTEYKADLYAVKKMLDYGFNPSQIGRVGLESLSTAQFERKQIMVNTVTNDNT